MGFWNSAAKFASKQFERGMLLYSGKQWGDIENDQDKIVAALEAQHNTQLNNERFVAHEQNSTLVYAVVGFIVSVIFLIVAVCFKLAIDMVRNNNNNQQQSIQLNTMRSSRSVNDANSSNRSL